MKAKGESWKQQRSGSSQIKDSHLQISQKFWSQKAVDQHIHSIKRKKKTCQTRTLSIAKTWRISSTFLQIWAICGRKDISMKSWGSLLLDYSRQSNISIKENTWTISKGSIILTVVFQSTFCFLHDLKNWNIT